MFWNCWAMGGSTLATQLKTFGEKTLRKHQTEVDELDAKLSKLVERNEKMKKMHSENMSSDDE